MKLHSALNDVKRSRGDDRRFPGERRSTTGRFSGFDDRLVHVAPNGALSDYSYPLSGLVGIDHSRFGLELDDTLYWLDEPGDQRYVGETALVETTHEVDGHTLTQYDLTLGRLHLTHFSLSTDDERDDTDPDATLYACVAFAPEDRVSRIGQLLHGDAVEVHHDREHDFLTAATDIEVTGQIPATFSELLESEPTELPRGEDDGRYEEARLSPITLAEVELSGSDASTTVATLLADSEAGEESRTGALKRARAGAAEHATRDALLEAAQAQAETAFEGVRAATDDAETVDIADPIADLRALRLLRAPTGARIAGPEFDPFYRYSGGYGYTWFRDDAEIAGFLLAADRRAGLGLEQWHRQSAHFYTTSQLADGTWPHRVWPRNGRLAPGWAHGRVEEAADSTDYQADQTASVAAYLATYLRTVDADDEQVRKALVAALDGLDATLADDGLPERVQNAWENMTGRFTHTAATFLEAYAAIARAPIADEHRERARDRARTVYSALDDLWVADRGCYALRLDDGDLDDRLDGSTFALAAAHREFDVLERDQSDTSGTSEHAGGVGVDADRLARLVTHIETTIDGLYRDPEGPLEGVARFEDDPWRVDEQADAKIWSVTTAWGAHAAAEMGALLAAHDHEAASRFDERARELLALVEPGGQLRRDGEYLPEQFFDDGTADSATPLGWPHALRLATAAELATVEQEPASAMNSDCAPVQD
ncbi:glucan 1,4-alpha-glucosidase [Natrialba hulunbeirensis JCM 10989]|uniref:Glucan 1,4-alpha-glucosidase n=1 Tax=Natrialba hulunbeirensis JCM 10989 TaxID=1227493 RepID=M0A906_9EURY|nr:hypothetical protein [Natrialba hulunbeirensis]ELY93823.1 glucan 1,4-alpha-glucosidase [Natrialba hulunbeirensis JCM 10989]